MNTDKTDRGGAGWKFWTWLRQIRELRKQVAAQEEELRRLRQHHGLRRNVHH